MLPNTDVRFFSLTCELVNAEVSGGGFPGWLSRTSDILRTNETGFLEATQNYVDNIGRIIADAQITNGGPVIAFQAENEYTFGMPWVEWPDVKYIDAVNRQFRDTGIVVPFSNSSFTVILLQPYTNAKQSITRPRQLASSFLENLAVPISTAMTTILADGIVPILPIGPNPVCQPTSANYTSNRARTLHTPSSNFKVALSTHGEDLASTAAQHLSTHSLPGSFTRTTSAMGLRSSTYT